MLLLICNIHLPEIVLFSIVMRPSVIFDCNVTEINFIFYFINFFIKNFISKTSVNHFVFDDALNKHIWGKCLSLGKNVSIILSVICFNNCRYGIDVLQTIYILMLVYSVKCGFSHWFFKLQLIANVNITKIFVTVNKMRNINRVVKQLLIE